MTTLTTTEASADGARLVDYDAIVVGSGFGGIYALHKLRNEQGLTVRAFEKGWRHRRDLVLQPVPGCEVRHRGLRLPLLLR